MKYEAASQKRKQSIAEALKKLMRQKPFSKITVSEIIKECNINRKTFYYHFEDIYDLLKWVLEKEAIEVVKQFDIITDYKEAIIFVMDYVEKNDYIINCAYDAIGHDEMRRFFYSDFIVITSRIIDNAEKCENLLLPPDFKEFLCKAYAEALAGVLTDWIKNRSTRDRENTIEYLLSFFKISSLSLTRELGTPK